MVFARRRHRSSGKDARPDRHGTETYLPATPLDGGVLSCRVFDEDGRLLPDATVTVLNRLNQRIGQGRQTRTVLSYSRRNPAHTAYS